MTNPLVATSGLLMLLAAPSAVPEGEAWRSAVAMLGQQQPTMHVPRVTVTSTTIILRSARPPAEMVEKKAGDCVKADRLQGFTVNRFDSVDLLLKDGSQLRARLARDCPALGFYSGFYIRRTKDGKICARRDYFRSRSGRACSVDGFTALVPAR